MTRIGTWNVNSLRVRLPQLLEWLALHAPDVMALQETKVTDELFPVAQLLEAGYHSVFSGQKTYNGVALLARTPPLQVLGAMPGSDDPQRRVLAASCGALRVVNLYVPNGQSPESEKFQYKLVWLKTLRAWLRTELAAHPNLVVLGDFNIAPEDRDVHDPLAWVGSVHVSPEERAALRDTLDLGLVDVFRRFEQPPGSFSWWDYRTGAFRRNHGLRIDLLLAATGLAEHCQTCTIDREARLAERASDHAPVVAEFDI